MIEYPFTVPKAAHYEIWNRIGFEFVRSVFEWRIDEGEWGRITPEELTTDLMELSFYREVAWLKMGGQELARGSHTLQIRIPRTSDKGKFNRILYASDALCISDVPFQPNSRFKPDESGRTEKDEAAARQVFSLSEVGNGERSSVVLAGDWEATRDDEQMPGEVAAPIAALPAVTHFRAIPVPSDKNESRPDLEMAHRLWYRARVKVPESMAGRSFYVEFPLNNLNTTVYVNGLYCGFEKSPFCRFSIDVTKGLKPGQVNELWVGIRDAWYGRSADPEKPLKLRKTFPIPRSFLGTGFQDLDYPLWNCPQSGILAAPTLVAAGKVYVSDCFVKPSVAHKALDTEISLSNTTGADQSGEIRQEVLEADSGKTVKTFSSRSFSVAAGTSVVLNVSAPWADPKLWWPDSPVLYRLRTTLARQGAVIDIQETTFGFREWLIKGTQFTLNGMPWHIWADCSLSNVKSTNEFLAVFKKSNNRTFRFLTAGQGRQDTWLGMAPPAALDFLDRNGIVVRRNFTLDGEAMGHLVGELDQDRIKKQGGSGVRRTFMKNWLDQCVAQVKGERNHPSIQLWSVENEFSYINLINLIGGSMLDEYEHAITKTHDAVMAVDPTRSVMTDGGGAMKDNSLGVHGDHYVATLDTRYPDQAYEPFVEGGGRGRWQWDMKRPRYIGEDYFASGIDPSDFAQWGGEVAFQGKSGVADATALCYRMLNEGYRWGGYYAGWHFWLGTEGGEKQWVANAPRAVFCRQWDWTFGSRQTVTRTFGVFNDTQYIDPLTFTRTLLVDGKVAWTRSSTHRVPPGGSEKFDETIELPAVRQRTEARLNLTLSAGTNILFSDAKEVSILPPPALDVSRFAAGNLAVFDPQGSVGSFLRSCRIPFLTVTNLHVFPASAKVLLVGPDAVPASECASPALAAYAAAGHAVIVLDQSSPLKYQAFPAVMERVTTNKEAFAADGHTGFIEDTAHSVLKGFMDKDFFTWGGPDSFIYHHAYMKPEQGGKSLLQVGPRLTQTALVEIPVGKGVMFLSQLKMGDRLAVNAVARQLLLNLIATGWRYHHEFVGVTACLRDEQLGKALDDIGLKYSKVDGPLAAIGDPASKIAVISATPANLATLAGAMPKVEEFWKRGGTIIVHGLTPDGLASYNKIVGVEHVIRPFVRERVQFSVPRNPLMAGLSNGDIVMLSGKRVFGFRADEYTVPDEFTYVVDDDEVAPFGKSDFGNYDKIVNGFFGTDGWPLIIDFPIPTNGQPFNIKISLPKEETVTSLTYKQSMSYNPTTKIALLFDGKARQEFVLAPNVDPQTFELNPPRRGSELTLQTCDWQISPDKSRNQGIENIWIKVQRSPEFRATVRPMLNLGGMMQYVKGGGGVVLCNLNFMENEVVPVNKNKKRTILAAVLRNLKATFAGGKTIIAGAGLISTPVDIHIRATTYKDERGWFGNKARTFAGLPAGSLKLGGIEYNIYEMATSPVPQVLMLGGNGIPGNLPPSISGIPVNTKADALFFLHTARLGVRMTENDRRDRKTYVMFKYVVHYADGQTAEIPIRSEIDIENYVQTSPAPISGAQLAWIRPYENSEDKAAAYAKQWNNPRPDVVIQSVDMIPVDPSRGNPVLLGLTAVKAE